MPQVHRGKEREDTSKTDKYITILPVSEGDELEVERLFDSIRNRDPTWVWEMKVVDGKFKVLVYSAGKNQAKLRGEWLIHNTALFEGATYETTHSLTLRTMLKEKPQKTEGLRALLKRDKVWREASQTSKELRRSE